MPKDIYLELYLKAGIVLLKDGDKITPKEVKQMIRESSSGIANANIQPENMIPCDLDNIRWLKHYPQISEQICEHSLRKVLRYPDRVIRNAKKI